MSDLERKAPDKAFYQIVIFLRPPSSIRRCNRRGALIGVGAGNLLITVERVVCRCMSGTTDRAYLMLVLLID
jgi:hypothetical protein